MDTWEIPRVHALSTARRDALARAACACYLDEPPLRVFARLLVATASAPRV
ncbi:MAG: hypothetical protein GX536_04225 [Actinobacteria bacterium]|nr:hypothetical protein [Actinomycetota bacterium]